MDPLSVLPESSNPHRAIIPLGLLWGVHDECSEISSLWVFHSLPVLN